MTEEYIIQNVNDFKHAKLIKHVTDCDWVLALIEDKEYVTVIGMFRDAKVAKLVKEMMEHPNNEYSLNGTN